VRYSTAFGMTEGTTHKIVKISADRIQPAPDDHWWVCYWGGEIQCAFGPANF
jgi:hypothetical protein